MRAAKQGPGRSGPGTPLAVALTLGAVSVLCLAVGIAVGAGPGKPAAEGAKRSTPEAVCGTWVLQQVDDLKGLEAALSQVIELALRTPHIRGLSLRVPWRAVDLDFALFEAGLKAARARDLDFSVRFMAGRHTPDRIFERGCAFYLREEGKNEKLKGRRKVPAPFLPDGLPNKVFEEEYDPYVGKLAKWCRASGVRLLHLPWYGQDWAELNHGKEVRALPGYTYENWLRAHERLIDIGLTHAGEDLAVEFPFSGYGPLTDAAVALADYVVKKIGPNNPRFFCQANGWGPNGDWGAPNPQTEAAFDRVWTRPICRGQQMIQPWDYDWKACFARLYANRATYCEVYAPSFLPLERKQKQAWVQERMKEQGLGARPPDLLAEEVGKFAEHCRRQPPLPPSPKP